MAFPSPGKTKGSFVRIQVRGIDKCDISGGISQLWKKTCL
jgi:hypothetical protein